MNSEKIKFNKMLNISLSYHASGFLPGIFSGGGYIVLPISIVMLIFLLLLDQISGGGAKVSEEATCLGGGAPTPMEESQRLINELVEVDLVHLLNPEKI